MAISNNGEFSTRNTLLAACLYYEGFTLLDVTINPHPTNSDFTIATFIFESSDTLLAYTRLVQVAKVEGNLVLFHEAYRKMLKMVKVGKL